MAGPWTPPVHRRQPEIRAAVRVHSMGRSAGTAPPPTTSVWSAADAAANGMTLSNGGLTVTPSGSADWQSLRTFVSKSSGKLYVEFALSTTTSNILMFGLASAGFDITSYLGTSNYSVGLFPSNPTNGTSYPSTGFTSNYSYSTINVTNGDVWGVAVDFTTGSIWLAHNNVWINSSNPATATAPVVSFVPATVGALFAGMSFTGAGGNWTLQSTAASQKYAPPSGFTAWDSAAPPAASWKLIGSAVALINAPLITPATAQLVTSIAATFQHFLLNLQLFRTATTILGL